MRFARSLKCLGQPHPFRVVTDRELLDLRDISRLEMASEPSISEEMKHGDRRSLRPELQFGCGGPGGADCRRLCLRLREGRGPAERRSGSREGSSDRMRWRSSGERRAQSATSFAVRKHPMQIPARRCCTQMFRQGESGSSRFQTALRAGGVMTDTCRRPRTSDPGRPAK